MKTACKHRWEKEKYPLDFLKRIKRGFFSLEAECYTIFIHYKKCKKCGIEKYDETNKNLNSKYSSEEHSLAMSGLYDDMQKKTKCKNCGKIYYGISMRSSLTFIENCKNCNGET